MTTIDELVAANTSASVVFEKMAAAPGVPAQISSLLRHMAKMAMEHAIAWGHVSAALGMRGKKP